jgi:hypothetical protein
MEDKVKEQVARLELLHNAHVLVEWKLGARHAPTSPTSI